MYKLLIISIIVWTLLFTLRVVQIGGIDPTYREEGSTLLLPLRQHLSETISQLMPKPESALLAGILLGSQEDLSFSFKKELKATSVIHIVVVSGQNLTILAGFLMSLVAFLGRRKTIILTLAVIAFYSILTGLGVPVIRAAIMVTLAYLAQALGKEGIGWWVLLFTAGAMLLVNPNWLFNISFQLSFLATFGVVVVAPIFIKSLKVVPRVLREDLAVTLAAQLLVIPVIAYNFQQLSLIGIVVNSLILWIVPIVMVGGLVSLGIGLVSIVAGQITGLIPSVLLTYFVYIVDLFAKAPGAGIKLGETGIILWAGYYLILGAGVWGMSKGNSKISN